jgi:5-(carboxyamino)imidazole ribonucleotide synthase
VTPLPPGARLGILGGGQLARMLAQEATRLGYRVRVLDPDPDCSAAAAAEVVVGRLDDAAAAARLAEGCDVVTVDTEHVPADVVQALEARTRCAPGARTLAILQDRGEQRAFLRQLGVPQPRWAAAHDEATAQHAVALVGAPARLKTRRGGYDGRGQARVAHRDEASAAWAQLAAPIVAEAEVPFERELSIIVARGLDGGVRAFPLVENVHQRGILARSSVPAAAPDGIDARAVEIATTIAEALGLVGVLTVELYLVSGELLVNEVAARVHNSGHFTLGACQTSQFEQHVRALAGLPLGDPSLLRPVVMVNLLGDLWRAGEPRWDALLADPGARLHLYGKREARDGRKMGHCLFLDETVAAARARAERAVRALIAHDPTAVVDVAA